MVVELSKEVWRGKWAEVTESFNSDDEVNDEAAGEEVSLAANHRGDEFTNGNEIRRSARPRRIAAKVAEADFSSMSDEDERPLKRRTSLSASATPSRGKLEQRRLPEGHLRSNASKLDEKRMRKRETNKNSARKMRLQRKEELNSLLQNRNELQDQLSTKTRDLRASQTLLQSMEKNYGILNTNYTSLAHNHDMLIVELLRHLACLRSQSGKTLEPQALSQMLAQFSPFLPEEGPLLLGEPALTSAKFDVPGLATAVPQGMDEGVDTVLIQVNPKPGTQVQIFRPKALRAQSGPQGLSSEIGKAASQQFGASIPMNGLSRQPSSHSAPIHPLPASFTEQAMHFHAPLLTSSKLAPRVSPQTPNSLGPPVKVSPSPAEDSTLLDNSNRSNPDAKAPESQSLPASQGATEQTAASSSGPVHSGPKTQALSYRASHQVIRPQPRSAGGVGSYKGTPAEQTPFAKADAAVQDTSPRAPPSSEYPKGPNKILSIENHLSGFQPVPRLA